jgi:predicted DNA-binding transcriptional regulator YafY
MANLEILDERAEKKPKGFRISDYSHKVFEMFDGDEVAVILQCKNYLMKYVVDRFGDKFSFEPGNDDTFTCEVEVCLSPTFYGWIFGFGGDIRIISPEYAVQSIIQMSKSMIAAES